MSYHRTGKHCPGSPQSQSRWWCQSRCVSRQQCPQTREKAADSVSAERSSAPCTAAEGELSMARGLCHSKGGKAPDPELCPGRAPVPEFSPQRAPVPALRKCPPEPKSSSARSLKAYSRPRASRAPSSVSYNSRVQPWKAGISQIPTLPPTIASSTAIVWQPLCGQSFPWLRLQPQRPGPRLGPLTRRLRHGS